MRANELQPPIIHIDVTSPKQLVFSTLLHQVFNAAYWQVYEKSDKPEFYIENGHGDIDRLLLQQSSIAIVIIGHFATAPFIKQSDTIELEREQLTRLQLTELRSLLHATTNLKKIYIISDLVSQDDLIRVEEHVSPHADARKFFRNIARLLKGES